MDISTQHSDQNLDSSVLCDASTSGLGEAFQQYSHESRVTIEYASRFLNSLEENF